MATSTWNNASGGDWLTAGNWSGGVPTSSVDAVLGTLSGAYTVTLATGEVDAANSLTISAASAALSLVGTATLAITGTVGNSGLLQIDAFSFDGGGALTAGGLLTNNTGGTVQVGNSLLTANTAATFGGVTNASGATLKAFGGSASLTTTVTMTGSVSNAGTIDMENFTTFAAGANSFTQTAGTTTIRGGFTAGAVAVNGGTFTINDSGSTFKATSLSVGASGRLTVASGSTATLTGSALAVSGTATIAGTLTPVGTTAVTVATGGQLVLNPTYSLGAGRAVGSGSSALQLAGSGAGIVNNSSNTTFTGFNALTIAGGATWTVNWATTALPGISMTGNNSAAGSVLTLTNTAAATPNLTGVTKFGTINLGNGFSNSVTVPAVTLAGGAVTIVGGNSGNAINASADGTGANGKTLTYVAGSGTDTFTGGNENDVVKASVAAIATDTFAGGISSNTLTVTNPGTATLSHATNFSTINLATGGTNNVTLVDATMGRSTMVVNGGATSSDTVTISDISLAQFTGSLDGTTKALTVTAVASGTLQVGDVILGAGVGSSQTITAFVSGTPGGVGVYAVSGAQTIASEAMTASVLIGKTLTFNAGTGVDTFTGGIENDIVRVKAVAVSADALNGGLGTNTLTLTTAGTAISLNGVRNFGTINLGGSTANVVTVTAPTLTAPVTINDVNGGTTIKAGTASGGQLTFNAGTGVDVFTGGTEADVVRVGAAAVNRTGESLNGGSGNNTLNLSSGGTFSLANVKNFGTINLTGSSNVVTVTDNTLTGNVTLGGGSSNTITVSTTASVGKTLTYATTAARDTFTGGDENDIVKVSAAALMLAGESLTGGTGANTLVLTTTGTFSLANAHNFGTVRLANGNNTVSATLASGEAITGFAIANIDTLNVQNTAAVDLTQVSKIRTINLGAAAASRTVSIGPTTLTGTTTATPVTLNESGAVANTVTSSATTGFLTYAATIAGDRFTGGGEADTVTVSLPNLASDTLNGGSTSGVNDTLTLTTAGAFTLAASGGTGTLSNFGTIRLAAGDNTVTLKDLNIGGGTLTIKDGASGNNIIDASADTTGTKLIYVMGTGADKFTGGSEIDIVKVGNGLNTDTLTGGSNAGNVLMLTAAGTFSLAGVSRFGTIDLNAAGGNTVTVTSGTLSGSLGGGVVTINDGTSGNNVVTVTGVAGETVHYTVGAGSSDTFTGGAENDQVAAASLGVGKTLTVKLGSGTGTVTAAGALGTIVVHAGTGADTLTGGSFVNEFFAGGNTAMTGGTTALNQYMFTTTTQLGAGNSIANFGLASDELVFSNGAFSLGFTGASSTPQNWSVASGTRTLATDFASNATGLFGATVSNTRLLYDTANGELFFSSNGTDASKHAVGFLTTGGSPVSSAAVSSHLFFVS